MKIAIHNIKNLSVRDIIVFERYYTGESIPDYWFKKPWLVENIYDNVVSVLALNKLDTSKTTGDNKKITENMLSNAKLYKVTTDKDLQDWIVSKRYNF